jgi:hypothetical protein
LTKELLNKNHARKNKTRSETENNEQKEKRTKMEKEDLPQDNETRGGSKDL